MRNQSVIEKSIRSLDVPNCISKEKEWDNKILY